MLNPQIAHNPHIPHSPVDTEFHRFQLSQAIDNCQSLIATLLDAQAGRHENHQDRPDGALVNFLKVEIDKLSNLL